MAPLIADTSLHIGADEVLAVYLGSNSVYPSEPPLSLDPDAAAYLTAVEAADGQPLETAVKLAINSFVVGCKEDNIWSALDVCVILAGARTFAGARVALRGIAPSSVAFVEADYDRKTGLKGDGNTKYLTTGKLANAYTATNQHMSVYVGEASTIGGIYLGAGGNEWGASSIGRGSGASIDFIQHRHYDQRTSTRSTVSSYGDATGFIGLMRNNASNYNLRVKGTNLLTTQSSTTGVASQFLLFRRVDGQARSNARIAMYTLGSALNLATLNARATALFADLANAIP